MEQVIQPKYQVIAGNIGEVYSGDDPIEANRVYGIYKRDSIANYGRVAGEPVCKMEDGEPVPGYDYPGTLTEDSDE